MSCLLVPFSLESRPPQRKWNSNIGKQKVSMVVSRTCSLIIKSTDGFFCWTRSCFCPMAGRGFWHMESTRLYRAQKLMALGKSMCTCCHIEKSTSYAHVLCYNVRSLCGSVALSASHDDIHMAIIFRTLWKMLLIASVQVQELLGRCCHSDPMCYYQSMTMNVFICVDAIPRPAKPCLYLLHQQVWLVLVVQQK